jgi:hypothetical protein
MARTYKVSRDYRTKTRKARQQAGCPEGRGCNVCGDNRRRSDVIRMVIAREKVTEVYV